MDSRTGGQMGGRRMTGWADRTDAPMVGWTVDCGMAQDHGGQTTFQNACPLTVYRIMMETNCMML